MQNKNLKIIIEANLRFSGSSGIYIFRLVLYLLNMTFIQNCIYMNFRINLTQFYINFSRQEYQIDVLYVSFNSWDSQVSAYTTFHFSFTVPLNSYIYRYICLNIFIYLHIYILSWTLQRFLKSFPCLLLNICPCSHQLDLRYH